MAGLSTIRVFAEDGDVVCMCSVCGGRLSLTNAPLSMLVEAMFDHLTVSHPERLVLE